VALDVVTLGEAMALFVAEEAGLLADARRFRRATAGAELNVAVGLSRLGLRVGYITRLGNDSLGRHLLQFIKAERIDAEQVRIDAGAPTGLMFKSRRLDGCDPDVEYFRRGSAAARMRVEPAIKDYAAGARHLHLSGIAPALSTDLRELVFELAIDARAAGRSVSFDPNLRPTLWDTGKRMVETLNALATHADLVMPGLSEGRLLSGCESPRQIADFYLARGARQVVVKLGAEGAYYADRATDGLVAGFAVDEVVDTVGAGDGFAVGVISAVLEGLGLAAAVRRGNAIGARVVRFPGDCDGLPNRAQLEQALANVTLSSRRPAPCTGRPGS